MLLKNFVVIGDKSGKDENKENVSDETMVRKFKGVMWEV